MLYLYRSNSQEYLLEKLGQIFITAEDSLLTPDFVLIQNYGMKNWVQSKLVDLFGISANIHFIFTNQFLQKILQPRFAQGKILLDKQEWEWKILEILFDILKESNDFSNYLNQNNKRELYQFAVHLADIFQKYALFYPQIFEENIDDTPIYYLQKRIWERIFTLQKKTHISSFIHNLQIKTDFSRQIPPRLLIFGVSYLPEIYLAIFSALSKVMDIYFFYRTSTKEYFGGLLSQKEITKQKIRFPKEDDFQALHYNLAHPLLSFARKESEFQCFLLDYGWDDKLVAEKYFTPLATTLLGKLQFSMFQLVNDTNEQPETWLNEQDHSIVIGQCHNSKREVEELHRYLLDILETNPDIHLKDILVKSPHIENYAPYIEQVFLRSADPLPYSIADSTVVLPNWFKSLLLLPQILQENFLKKEILKLLDCPEILQKFDLDSEDLPKLNSLLDKCNLHWGKDLAYIQSKEPLEHENFSWQHTKDRLLSACVLDKELVVDEQFYETLGNFLHFLDSLFEIIDEEKGYLRPQSLEQWCQSLADIVANLYLLSTREHFAFLQIQAGLADALEIFVSKKVICFEIIFAFLENFGQGYFRQQRQGDFFKNGITFCKVQPMRSIPFKVICFLGLDDASFPRRQERSSLNLLNVLQNKLDFRKRLNLPNTKNEDFYIFWETILSAKNFFYVSFVGWDKDGQPALPSLALSTLLQFFCKKLKVASYEKLSFFRKHFLYMFDDRYFQKHQNYKNYSRYLHNLAKVSSLSPHKNTMEFIPIQNYEVRTIKNMTVKELLYFFSSPIIYFAENVLGIKFLQLKQESSKYELYTLSNLQSYNLAKKWLQRRNEGRQNEEIVMEFFTQEVVPPLQILQKLWQKQLVFLENWKEKIDSYTLGKKIEYVAYTKLLCGILFFGGNSFYKSNIYVQAEPAKWNIKKKQKLWLQHLFLCSLFSNKKPQSYWIGKNDKQEVVVHKVHFVADAQSYLKQNVEIYLAGLAKPLAFHSKIFAKYPLKFADASASYEPVDSSDPKEHFYWRQCFGTQNALAQQVKGIYESIIQPMDEFFEEL